MKLHFEPNLDYQQDANDSVVDLFCGQEICRTEFTVGHVDRGGESKLAWLIQRVTSVFGEKSRIGLIVGAIG